jgi:hypothetical protein
VTRLVTLAFREDERNGGHCRVSVFVGRDVGWRGYAGQILLRIDEWDELRERLLREEDVVTHVLKPLHG